MNIDEIVEELEKVGNWRVTQCYQKCPAGNYCAEISVSKSFIRKVIYKYGDTPTEAMQTLLKSIQDDNHEVPSSNR